MGPFPKTSGKLHPAYNSQHQHLCPQWSSLLQNAQFGQLSKTLTALYRNHNFVTAFRSPSLGQISRLIQPAASCPISFYYVPAHSTLRPVQIVYNSSYNYECLNRSHSPTWCTTSCRLSKKRLFEFVNDSSAAFVLGQ
jgi:hypothetical protein